MRGALPYWLGRRSGAVGAVHREVALRGSALAHHVVDVLADRQVSDVVLLDLRSRSTFTDHFVVATVDNVRQMRAVIDALSEEMARVATVIDLASRRVVGWAMAEHLRATLVSDALHMGVESRRPPPGLMFHTDRGAQYTAKDFTALLAGHEIRQSLSATAPVLGQRGGGELVRDPRERAHLPALLAHPGRGASGAP